MKKIYQKPAIQVTSVSVSSMICVSGNLDNTKQITETSGFGSRRNSDWFDDDEEEY